MWFKKTRLETPFKGDNVKASVKRSNCEKCFFLGGGGSVTIQSLENDFGFLL